MASAHLLLGDVSRKHGKMNEAIAEYREALRLDPASFLAHMRLGAILCDHKHNYGDAIGEFRAAIRINPHDATSYMNLGNALFRLGNFGEAIDEYRTAIRRDPQLSDAYLGLGHLLMKQGKLNEAAACYRTLIRLRPDDPAAHTFLADALIGLREPVGAIAEHRAAIRLRKDDPVVHYSLAAALRSLGKLDEAIAEYREAIRLKPDYPEAHCDLGNTLVQQGLFAEGVAALPSRSRDGIKVAQDWPNPSAQRLRAAEHLMELEKKLSAILTGQAIPADAAEMVGLAQICYGKKFYSHAASLWDNAFKAEPALADDMTAANRYNAACAAALAGSGNSKDDPPLESSTKGRWYKQALAWLRDDLNSWTKIVDTGFASGQNSGFANARSLEGRS